nr:hypothetical protein [Streptomyces sp. NRRL S-337]
MTLGTMSAQITDFANRADPYPLYAALRKSPVTLQDDGSYLVSTYYEVRSLANDPRLSNDLRNRAPGAGGPAIAEEDRNLPPSFIFHDPPEHDRLRETATRPFGPPHSPRFLHDMRGELAKVIAGLLDTLEGKDEIDVVDDFAYPYPSRPSARSWACRARTYTPNLPTLLLPLLNAEAEEDTHSCGGQPDEPAGQGVEHREPVSTACQQPTDLMAADAEGGDKPAQQNRATGHPV